MDDYDLKNDPVHLALRGAIEKHDSVELRVALGKHLQSKGLPEEALRQFEGALTLSPSDLSALEGAKNSAELAGDPARAASYRLTLDTLTGKAPSPNVPGPASEVGPPTLLLPPDFRCVASTDAGRVTCRARNSPDPFPSWPSVP